MEFYRIRKHVLRGIVISNIVRVLIFLRENHSQIQYNVENKEFIADGIRNLRPRSRSFRQDVSRCG